MSTADSVKTELAGLLTKANAATGNADTTLHDAVYALVEGYGQGGGGDIDALIDGSITEITSNATKVSQYAFYGRTSLTRANFPEATAVGNYAFRDCSKLTSINFPKATSTGQETFRRCSALEHIHLPSVTTVKSNSFQYCTGILSIDLPAVQSFATKALEGCSALTALILRGETVPSLDVSTLTSTPIYNGTGYIYVPAALVEEYKAAATWSTYAAQIRALEDYTVDGTITGELDPNKI